MNLYRLLERTRFRAVAARLYGVTVVGADRIPASGPVILVANHESLFDPWLLALATPRQVRYMAKAELWRFRLVGAALESFGAFPVERGAGDRTAMSRAASLLREGRVLGMFPQGTSKRVRARPFHRGAARLALATGAPIVPVTLVGTRGVPRPWRRRRVAIVATPACRDRGRPADRGRRRPADGGGGEDADAAARTAHRRGRVVIEHRWALWLVGWGVAATLLFVLYLVQRGRRDATAVDAGWALSLVLLAVLYAVLAPGDLSHRALIVVVAGSENGRIAVLVARRIGKGEDSRYRELRARWRARGREQRTFAIFYQAQALLAAMLSVAFLLAAFDRRPGLAPVEWAGAALWLVAAALEATADRQLAAFRRKAGNEGKTMRTGLWRYSRHPNYFFQTTTWLAYALIAVAAPWGWIAFGAPLLILYLVLFVTGVRPAEESSLRSRGEDYRRYQRETSVLVPWFPRSSTG